MPSTPSDRLLLELQATGEGLNTWGAKLVTLFQMVEAGICGFASVVVNTTASLTSTNYTDTDATAMVLMLSGTGGTLTIPGRERVHIVANFGSGAVTITTGSGNTVDVSVDGIDLVICDGTDVYSLGYDGLTIKDYIDQELLSASAGELPGQPGNAGKYLTTDGANASWADVAVAIANVSGFPTQSGNSGKLLTTDGSALSWLALATASEILDAAAKIITADQLFSAAASVALTDATTISADGDLGWNFHVTLGGNRTLGAPTNFKPGQSGRIRIVQDSTGSRTLSFNSAWKFAGGTDPTLSTTANAVDVLTYYVHDASNIECGFMKGMA